MGRQWSLVVGGGLGTHKDKVSSLLGLREGASPTRGWEEAVAELTAKRWGACLPVQGVQEAPGGVGRGGLEWGLGGRRTEDKL